MNKLSKFDWIFIALMVMIILIFLIGFQLQAKEPEPKHRIRQEGVTYEVDRFRFSNDPATAYCVYAFTQRQHMIFCGTFSIIQNVK